MYRVFLREYELCAVEARYGPTGEYSCNTYGRIKQRLNLSCHFFITSKQKGVVTI